MFHENGRLHKDMKLSCVQHRIAVAMEAKRTKRKNGDGNYEILMVSLDLHKTGFGRRRRHHHHRRRRRRRRRARNLMLAVFMFTLRSYSPIWMGYSHVCILPWHAWIEHRFVFLLFERWPSVFRFSVWYHQKVNNEPLQKHLTIRSVVGRTHTHSNVWVERRRDI